jgi:hypothetical protein
MAWNWFFGDKKAYYTEKAAQIQSEDYLKQPTEKSSRRLKRKAAQRLSIGGTKATATHIAGNISRSFFT